MKNRPVTRFHQIISILLKSVFCINITQLQQLIIVIIPLQWKEWETNWRVKFPWSVPKYNWFRNNKIRAATACIVLPARYLQLQRGYFLIKTLPSRIYLRWNVCLTSWRKCTKLTFEKRNLFNFNYTMKSEQVIMEST